VVERFSTPAPFEGDDVAFEDGLLTAAPASLAHDAPGEAVLLAVSFSH